jgi:hypothetical protein
MIIAGMIKYGLQLPCSISAPANPYITIKFYMLTCYKCSEFNHKDSYLSFLPRTGDSNLLTITILRAAKWPEVDQQVIILRTF